MLKRVDRQKETIESLELQLSESCHDVERLELELVDQAAETFAAERTNRELRDYIAKLERVPTLATSVTWSRERDNTGAA